MTGLSVDIRDPVFVFPWIESFPVRINRVLFQLTFILWKQGSDFLGATYEKLSDGLSWYKVIRQRRWCLHFFWLLTVV